MRASRNWGKGVSAKKIGEISKKKKARQFRKDKKEDICLNCKEKKCNGTCNKFKR
jgi:hypothetical protein